MNQERFFAHEIKEHFKKPDAQTSAFHKGRRGDTVRRTMLAAFIVLCTGVLYLWADFRYSFLCTLARYCGLPGPSLLCHTLLGSFVFRVCLCHEMSDMGMFLAFINFICSTFVSYPHILLKVRPKSIKTYLLRPLTLLE